MNKIPWNEPTYGEKRTIYRKLRDTDERQNKEMEGYSILLGWKNQYGENDWVTKSNLEIESNIKLSVAFFTELEQKISQFVWRHRRPPKAKVILRKKNRQYLGMQTETTWGTISHQSEWLLSKSPQGINAGECVEKREPSYIAGGNAN